MPVEVLDEVEQLVLGAPQQIAPAVFADPPTRTLELDGVTDGGSLIGEPLLGDHRLNVI